MIQSTASVLSRAICVGILALGVAAGAVAQDARVTPHGLAQADREEDRGRLIVVADIDLQQVVVVDPRLRKLMVYAVAGASTHPVVVRDLDSDFFSEADVLPIPVIPDADVPGSDLDGVPRPDDAVRIGFLHEGVGGSGTWMVTYLVRGSLPERYAAIRSSLAGWRVLSERVSMGSRVLGTLQLESGPRRLLITIHDYQPGFQRVKYELDVP
jgi:hypothetical protein